MKTEKFTSQYSKLAIPNIRAHTARRAALAKTLKQGIIIIPTASEVPRNADADYAFRWDSFFSI